MERGPDFLEFCTGMLALLFGIACLTASIALLALAAS